MSSEKITKSRPFIIGILGLQNYKKLVVYGSTRLWRRLYENSSYDGMFSYSSLYL
jgi:hypothetical protein